MANRMSEWISVKERLPEDALTDKQREARSMIRCILTDGKRSFAGSREKNAKGHWFWNRYSTITHWMPLPTPPGEEDTHE